MAAMVRDLHGQGASADASLGGMSDSALIEAFLEMLSAERGARANTLDAYARDLEDARAHVRGGLRGASAEAIEAYVAGLAQARAFAGDGAAADFGAAAILSLLAAGQCARRRSDLAARCAEARAVVAEDAIARRDRAR